jgi:threonine dehydrogenase-like Zn-dependent dehydrogenase
VLGIINRDGCMAQWLVLPARNLLPVPSSLGDELAVFCEPLAAACRILEQGLLQDDSSQQVAVVGGCWKSHAVCSWLLQLCALPLRCSGIIFK